MKTVPWNANKNFKTKLKRQTEKQKNSDKTIYQKNVCGYWLTIQKISFIYDDYDNKKYQHLFLKTRQKIKLSKLLYIMQAKYLSSSYIIQILFYEFRGKFQNIRLYIDFTFKTKYYNDPNF